MEMKINELVDIDEAVMWLYNNIVGLSEYLDKENLEYSSDFTDDISDYIYDWLDEYDEYDFADTVVAIVDGLNSYKK